MDINARIVTFLILAPTFLFALTFHELAHGYAAWRLGDPTARDAGRLTMNPIKHIDLLGALFFLIANIGWAKPVPVNPGYFRNPRQGMLVVALAGPGANLLLAAVSAAMFRLLIEVPISSQLAAWLMVPAARLLEASVWINVMLAVFNCLPIPPLDGSRVLMGLLPPAAARSYAQMEMYGFVLLLVLFQLGVVSKVIEPLITSAVTLLLG